MPPKKTATRSMSDDHKAALAEGREHGRKVRRYLEAIETNRPKRGRKRSPDAMRNRLTAIEDELMTADPLKRLQLVQERLTLQTHLDADDQPLDLDELEGDFIAVAKGYSERKGITYAAWREIGVEPAVLKKAGISRGQA
jgi:hypothetical protein